MKRIYMKLVLIVAAVSIFAIGASAETYTGSCGDKATYEFDSSTGIFTVKGTGAMKDYTNYSWCGPWGQDDSVKTVVISNGITTVGKNAFYGCAKGVEKCA